MIFCIIAFRAHRKACLFFLLLLTLSSWVDSSRLGTGTFKLRRAPCPCCCVWCVGVLLQGNDEQMKCEPGNPLKTLTGHKDTPQRKHFPLLCLFSRGDVHCDNTASFHHNDWGCCDFWHSAVNLSSPLVLWDIYVVTYLCIGSWNVCFLYTVVVFTVGCCCNLQHYLPHSCK